MYTDPHGFEAEPSEAVIGPAFERASILGAGFSEKFCWSAVISQSAPIAPKSGVPFDLKTPMVADMVLPGTHNARLLSEKLIQPHIQFGG